MKKNLKKTLSAGLAAMMALSLAACGGGSSDAPATTAAGKDGAGEAKQEEAAGGDVKTIKLLQRFHREKDCRV